MAGDDPRQARRQWLDHWLDLEPEARAAALDDPAIPAAWRNFARRLDTTTGEPRHAFILDRSPAVSLAPVLDVPEPGMPGPGQTVGRYTLIDEIGTGGMATVWSARPQDPEAGPLVAIKFLRVSWAQAGWRERFRREQRILARLVHPNISRLLDAGVDARGTPYLVMDRIDGLPVTRWCDQRLLGLAGRVRLFRTVCAAVAFAHGNLVIHRDLKPGNVLVDADGVPHLLDFGIAKLLDASDAAEDPTRTGMVLATPAYAAPEQLAGGAVTMATDVFGLGALLHELLCGVRAVFRTDGMLLTPSTRATGDAASARGLGGARALSAQLRGDLDAILARALRPEPAQRYASAHELAEDLGRWLDDAPVVARQGQWRYRAGKFARRHWLAIGTTALVVLGLGLATVVSMRAGARAEAAAAIARAEAARARDSRDFALELLHDLRPGSAVQTPQQLLDRAARRVAVRFADDPGSRVALLLVLGELERSHGRLDASEEHLLQAAMLAARDGDGAPDWLAAEASLAHTLFRAGRYVPARDRLAGVLARFDAAGGVAGRERILALARLGQLEEHAGDPEAGLALLGEADQLAARLLDSGDPLRLTVRELHGGVLANTGRLDAARDVLHRNLVQIRARFGDHDLAVVSALESLAVREIEAGSPEAALPLLVEARATADALLEGPHVLSGYVDNSLGVAELHRGRPTAARAHFLRALATFQALYAPPHRQLEATVANLGEAAFEAGSFAEAADWFDAASRQRGQLAQATPLPGLDAACLAAEAAVHAGDLARARAALVTCRARIRDTAPDDVAGLAVIEAELAWRMGDRDGARARLANHQGDTLALPAHHSLWPVLVEANSASPFARAPSGDDVVRGILVAGEGRMISRPCTTDGLIREIVARLPPVSDPDLRALLAARTRAGVCANPGPGHPQAQVPRVADQPPQ